MGKRGVFIFFCFFINFACLAQTGEIYGVISDTDSTKLGAAFVSLFKGGVQINATYSSFDGHYEFTGLGAGQYDVSVQALSYQLATTQGIVVGTNQKVEVEFVLKKESQSIGAVEIVTYRKPLIDKDKQAKVYTGEEIENLAVRELSEIVATDVDVVSQDDGSGEINVRGQRSEGTQFIVDGVKINGTISIPQAAIEQVEVISGGVPAMYGDNIGGVILVTTKGYSAKPFGAIEGITSNGLDGYNYNLVTASYSGPLLPNKKDSTGTVVKKSPIGFLITGEYRYVKDPRPSALGVWQVNQNTLNDLEQNPLRTGANGLGTFRNAEFLTQDDLYRQKANVNVAQQKILATTKIDYKPSKLATFAIGGTFAYSRQHNYIYEYSLLNSVNNPEEINTDYTTFLVYKQRLRLDSVKWINAASFSFQADYSSSKTTIWDDTHRDNMFDYGHVGRFKTHREKVYSYEADGPNGDAYYFQGERDVFYEFLGGGANQNAANYTSQYYDLYDGFVQDNYENFIQAANGGAVLNGDRPESVHGLWFNTGRQYNGYQILEQNQKRVLGSFVAKLFDKHQITFGVEYEERIQRGYELNPMGLWTIMRQLANSKNTDLDLNNPNLTSSNGVFTDTVNYNNLYQGGSIGFYELVRDQFGLDYDAYFDSDFYGPENYSLDLFTPDELMQEGNGIFNGVGYTHTRQRVQNSSLNDFFHGRDENGVLTRVVAPLNPIYLSGYIQDKFQFKDIVFNVGVRIDRFDANQPVMRDPYVLYDSYKVSEIQNNYDIPVNVPSDAVAYVNSLTADNPTLLGFRLEHQWYDASGNEIIDPEQIAQASATGEITPYLKNPDIKIGDSDYNPNQSFEDYKPQISVMPRISFTFNLSDNASFFAHYDVLTQRPNAMQSLFLPQQYLFLENNVGGFLTNPNLKPQTTIDYEVGYQQALNEKSAITVSAFYREMQDLIQITGINYAYPSNYITYGNIDKALIKGFSIKYDLRPINTNLSLFAGYTLQFADGTGSSPVSSASLIQQGFPNLRVMLPLDFDQRHTFKAVANYAFKPGKRYLGPDWGGYGRKILGGFSANVVGKLSSGRPFTSQGNFTPDANIINTERRLLDGLINGNRLPWIYTADLRLSRKFLFGFKKEATYKFKSDLYLVVTNLFNTKNIVRVYNATGNADDDGYLDAATSQPQINAQTNYESYTDLYSIKIANPMNYALPRQMRLGLLVTF